MWICNDLCKALVSAGFPSRLFFSCQLGWVVVDGIPPAPSMSLCQEESTRRLGSLLQSFTGPMESHHFEKKNLFILFVILLVLTSWSRLCIFLESKWHKNWQSFWSVSPKRLQWVQLDSLWAEDLRTSWLQLCLESFWNALHRALRCLAVLSKDVKVQTSTGRFYNSAVCPSMSIIGSNNCHIACRRKRHLKYFKVFTVELIVQCTICSSGVLLLSTKPYMELYCIHLYTVLIYTHKYNVYLNILYLQNSAFQLSPACATAQCHLFESSPRSAEKVQASIHPPWRWAHTSNV